MSKKMSSNAEIFVYPLSSTSSHFSNYVSYSCGLCGYELNLSSVNRDTSMIVGDEAYLKLIKRGVISFFSIDESRFTQITKVVRWRLFRRQTKLLCRNCGSCIGAARNSNGGAAISSTSFSVRGVKPNSATWDGISSTRMYEIKIRSLRPLSVEQ